MLTTINKNVISEDDIKLIMNRWDRTDEKHHDSLGRLVWDFHHHENEKDREYIMGKIDPYLPKTEVFNYVMYGHIAEHQKGAFLPYNVDLFPECTGVVIVFFCDSVSGGRLLVNDTIVSPTMGTVVTIEEPDAQQYQIETVYENSKTTLHYAIIHFTDQEPQVIEEPEDNSENFKTAQVNIGDEDAD